MYGQYSTSRLRRVHLVNKILTLCNSFGSYAIMLDCWKEEPKKRPDFSKLVETISLTLEAEAGYMKISMFTKEEHPVAADVEVKNVADIYSVQSPSEKEGRGQKETAM